MSEHADKVRLDKWLWAARFFKTRSLASDAIDGGKVLLDQQRIKPAKEVRIGATIYIKRKEVDIEVVVMALSSVRRSAPEAQQLYQETQQSLEKREQAKVSRLADHAKRERGAGRPTKRQIRDIRKFTGIDYF
jgi:ribosome-associated heat shock protein Hsp15